jgi:hypothetical protein
MSELDSIYLHLLRVGFVVLKQAPASGDTSWVYAEVEMLHNIPSLVGEQNPKRHRYYWDLERPHYIAWVAAHGSGEARSQMRTYYEPIWSELARLHEGGIK